MLGAMLGLAGCGTDVSNTMTADNRPAYEFRCGGLFDSKVDCNLTASEYCPYGYNPVTSGPGRLVAVCAVRPPSKTGVRSPPPNT